jgi:uncharacterized protein DUF1566
MKTKFSSKKYLLSLFIVIFALFFLIGCAPSSSDDGDSTDDTSDSSGSTATTSPTIVSVSPGDSSTDIDLRPIITVTFATGVPRTESMAASSTELSDSGASANSISGLTVNTTDTTCAGSTLQVSSGNFGSDCVKMSAAPVSGGAFGGDCIAGTYDQSGLVNLKLEGFGTSVTGISYQESAGYCNYAVWSSFDRSDPFDGNISFSTTSRYYNCSCNDWDVPNCSEVSGTGASGSDTVPFKMECARSQGSKDKLTMSYGLSNEKEYTKSPTPVASASSITASDVTQTFTVVPAANLSPETTYKIKLTTGVSNSSGEVLAAEYVSATGFQTGVQRLLPDTDQTGDTTVSGDDEDYSINPISFTDNGDSTITDDNTNLMWADAKDADVTWASADSYCSALTHAGQSDWRLPSVKEVLSIFDYSIAGYSSTGLLDQTYFSVVIQRFWTSDVNPHNEGYAFTVDGTAGRTYSQYKGYDQRDAICVRSIGSNSVWPLNFMDTGTGVIEHPSTDLMWQQSSTVSDDWEDAITDCEALSLGGYDDWRLSNLKELLTLVSFEDEGYFGSTTTYCAYKDCNNGYFAGEPVDQFWTSTRTSMSGYSFGISFSSRLITYTLETSDSTNARCVRGGI